MLNTLDENKFINLNGYGRLNWNDSIETFQSIYSDVCEVGVYINGKRISSLRKFSVEENHLDNVKLTKIFEFDKNRLFCVTVDYGILSPYHSGLLELMLYNHYGKFDWYCLKRNDNKKIKYGFNIFNDNIRIILVIEEILGISDGYKNNHMVKDRIVNCIYVNRKNDKKLGLMCTDNFELINMKDYSKIAL